jgi:hypothetical protein
MAPLSHSKKTLFKGTFGDCGSKCYQFYDCTKEKNKETKKKERKKERKERKKERKDSPIASQSIDVLF